MEEGGKMITLIVVTFVCFVLIGFVFWVMILGRESSEPVAGIALCLALIIGGLVTIWIGSRVPYIQITKTQPIVSIYTNQSENEIYLKAISGSQLIYRIDEDGVPREQTVSTGKVKAVKIEDVNPYLEITTYLFKEKWYKYFVFSTNDDEYVFHVPATGVEADINDLLK